MAGEFVVWFDRRIFLDDTYLVYFSDQKRKMTKEERAEYDRINSWPDKLRMKYLAEMNPVDNPNVTPMTGRKLMEFAEQGYIPQFDMFFDEKACAGYAGSMATAPKPTRRLTLIPAAGFEYFLNNSRIIGGK